ncbi:MAG: 4-phosphoerythronate dehydrogenase, partial [Verrucomicrobia bacterium]
MKIICAETVLLGHEALSHAGKTVAIPDREITRNDLLDADALIVRSKTKINRELLHGTPVKFVGTATAGTDHIDAAWLESKGIYWSASPGCNANSVSEYLVAALLTLGRRHGFDL